MARAQCQCEASLACAAGARELDYRGTKHAKLDSDYLTLLLAHEKGSRFSASVARLAVYLGEPRRHVLRQSPPPLPPELVASNHGVTSSITSAAEERCT